MKRREFVIKGGIVATGATLVNAPAVHAKQKYQWKLILSFPKELLGVGTGPVRLAKIIEEMSEGQISIKVFGAGELVPPLETLNAVSSGKAEMGFGSPYYWENKHEAFNFFTAVPFGLTSHEMLTWLQFGGGQALMDELYSKFDLKPFPAGSSGTQMGGWYNKKINSVNDFNKLRIRMTGLGATVLKELGAKTVNLPPNKIYDALKSNTIDAADWIGPYNDEQLKLYEVAKYYYWPGWHEPGSMLDCFINAKIYQSLPTHLQEIIAHAVLSNYQYIWSIISHYNGLSLANLIKKHHVKLVNFPERVLMGLTKTSQRTVAELASKDPLSAKIYQSFINFRNNSAGWTQIGEEAFSYARSLSLSYLE